MVLPSLLMREKVVKISDIRHNPKKALKGFVRVVSDKNGLHTDGFFLDKAAFMDLLESMEYSDPGFWDELERSRRSGRVSSKDIEKRLGIK